MARASSPAALATRCTSSGFQVAASPMARGKTVAFSQIYALQVVKEYVRGDETNYWSYELNLVLQEGQRLSVVDHGNLETLLDDARRVRDLLGCKLWDAASPAQ